MDPTQGDVRFCWSCGTPRAAGAEQCAQCGTSFAAGPPTEEATAVQPPPAPSPAVPAYASAPPPTLPPPMPGERYEPSARAPVPVPVPVPNAAAPAGASPRTGTRGKALTVQVGSLQLSLLPIAGGVAAIVSCFLVWLDPPGPGGTADALDAPVTLKFLWDPFNPGTGFKLGIVVIVLGAIAVVLSALPRTGSLRRLAGLAVAAVAGVYVVQLARVVNEVQGQSVGDVFDYLGPGTYVAAAAGLLIALSR